MEKIKGMVQSEGQGIRDTEEGKGKERPHSLGVASRAGLLSTSITEPHAGEMELLFCSVHHSQR